MVRYVYTPNLFCSRFCYFLTRDWNYEISITIYVLSQLMFKSISLIMPKQPNILLWTSFFPDILEILLQHMFLVSCPNPILMLHVESSSCLYFFSTFDINIPLLSYFCLFPFLLFVEISLFGSSFLKIASSGIPSQMEEYKNLSNPPPPPLGRKTVE